VRTLTLLLLSAALGLCAGCSSLPGCADDDCPKPPTRILDPGAQVPIYETVREPIYEERRTPVWGEKTLPVYQERKKPVTISIPTCDGKCDKVVELWDRTEEVQIGVRRVRACLGYKTERVQVGTCCRKVIVGWRAAEPTCP
jgi:hypothetical protein